MGTKTLHGTGDLIHYRLNIELLLKQSLKELLLALSLFPMLLKQMLVNIIVNYGLITWG